MEKLKLSVSSPVEGADRFWNRQAEIRLLTELLDQGEHVQLIAQRRIGKTSLMREVARRIKDRYICLFVDLQKHESPADAIAALSAETQPYRDLWGKTKSLFSNILSAVADHVDSLNVHEITLRFRDGMVGEDWKVKGDGLFNVLASAEPEIVIFMDEVPILVNRILKGDGETITPAGRREVDRFLSWLRDNCHRHRGKIRVVLTGSIGLSPILHQAGLSATINHFTPLTLSPWSDETAIGCLHALANDKRIKLDDGVCEGIVQRLGCCIPHHVQMFFWLAYSNSVHHEKNTISLSDIDTVYATNMLGIRGHTELSHYEERLRMVLGSELASLAFNLLTVAAVQRELTIQQARKINAEYSIQGWQRDEALNEVLGILEHDGYLCLASENTYVFVSCLLRDWWFARFGSLAIAGGK